MDGVSFDVTTAFLLADILSLCCVKFEYFISSKCLNAVLCVPYICVYICTLRSKVAAEVVGLWKINSLKLNNVCMVNTISVTYAQL